MTSFSNAVSKTTPLTLTITRTFPAPREKVFKAWTKSRHIIHWWGPEGSTVPAHKMDIHPGGIYRCDVKGADGKDHWALGVFKEMLEPSHLAFTHSWEEDGKLTAETLVAVELTEENGNTDMVFYQSGFDSEEDTADHKKGWSESFDRLDKYLATETGEF